MYDIIGDIHGHYDLLVSLLEKLGYTEENGVYSHLERKVIFTGDIIDRGDKIRPTIILVRKMVEAGNAYCILGNHELNAILYETLDKSGKYLRKRLLKYRLPLNKTLEEFKNNRDELLNHIKWFRTLPIYLDLGNLRIVHGGWNDNHISLINNYTKNSQKLKKSFLKNYLTIPELKIAVNELIKGKEFVLPKDLLLKDDRGIIRRQFRIKWWESAEGKTFQEIAFGNKFELPAYSIPKELLPQITPYPQTAPPVFLGHYCLPKRAKIFQGNVCCVDSCVIRNQRLTAYRWNGEQILSKKNLVKVKKE